MIGVGRARAVVAEAAHAFAVDVEPTDRLSVRLDYEYLSKDISEPAALALLPAVGGVVTMPDRVRLRPGPSRTGTQ